MRYLPLLLALLTMGCGKATDTGNTNPVPSKLGAVPSTPGGEKAEPTKAIPSSIKTLPITKDAAFSETDARETTAWILEGYKRACVKPSNDFAGKDPVNEFVNEMAAVKGRKVKWEYSGIGVRKKPNGKAFLEIFNTAKADKDAERSAVVFVASVPPDAESKGYNLFRYDAGIEIAPNDVVSKIGKNDTVVVEGTVEKVFEKLKLASPTQSRTFTVCFVLKDIAISIKK